MSMLYDSVHCMYACECSRMKVVLRCSSVYIACLGEHLKMDVVKGTSYSIVSVQRWM